MNKRVVVIQGHPDPAGGHFAHERKIRTGLFSEDAGTISSASH